MISMLLILWLALMTQLLMDTTTDTALRQKMLKLQIGNWQPYCLSLLLSRLLKIDSVMTCAYCNDGEMWILNVEDTNAVVESLLVLLSMKMLLPLSYICCCLCCPRCCRLADVAAEEASLPGGPNQKSLTT